MSEKFKILSASEPKKKFQIENQSSKKFEIKDETPKKKFVIHTETERDISLEWFQQINSNDCGPCLLLNGLHLLKVESIPNSIVEVRAEVNRMRIERGRPELPSDGWFTSEDIGEYLAKVGGLNVEEFPIFPYEVDSIKTDISENISQRPYDLLYSTEGRHFRAVSPTEEVNQYYLLDSFLNEPRIVGQEEVNDLLDRSISSRTENRVERIGIARKSDNPGYRVIS